MLLGRLSEIKQLCDDMSLDLLDRCEVIDPRTTPNQKYVERLYEQGITQGCGSSGGQPLFCPKDLVSRQQMASFLIRAFA